VNVRSTGERGGKKKGVFSGAYGGGKGNHELFKGMCLDCQMGKKEGVLLLSRGDPSHTHFKKRGEEKGEMQENYQISSGKRGYSSPI